jgi:ribosome-associated heat shock protein Hsp15
MSVRIDKWLWHARFFRTRAMAQSAASSGHIRINGLPVDKAHHIIKPGDVLTMARGREVLVIRVRGEAARRGPAPEAQALYEIVDETPLDRGPDAP